MSFFLKYFCDEESRDNKEIFAIFLGFLATMSLSPFNLTFLLIFVFSLLYELLVGARNKKEAFFVGFWFGLSFFSSSLYWIMFPFTLDIKEFFWLFPITLVGLNSFFAFYMGLFAVSFYVFPKRGVISFSFLFTFFELLRGGLFTGFPWNYLSYSWSNNLEIMQSVSIVGIEGLMFFTVLYSLMPVFVFRKKSLNIFFCFCSPVLMVMLFFWGMNRMDTHKNEDTKFVVRLVQSGMKSLAHWNEGFAIDTVNTNIDLSLSKNLDKVTHVIWSESSVPFTMSQESKAFILELLHLVPKTIIVGSDRMEDGKFYNAIFLLKDNMIFDFYDKLKLVPFGEFIPFKKVLSFINLVTGSINYSFGENAKLLDLDDAMFTPTICYESIFPGDFRKENSNWIVNITNDSWFGKSTGPYQHFDALRARSIESGLPAARSASTGISVMFDALGRVLGLIELGSRGIIDITLPKKISETIYSKYYFYIHWFLIFAGALIVLWGLWEHRKNFFLSKGTFF